MAIITEARMQQLRGKYNQLNKEALLPGEFAICDDHNPIVRTNTGYKEILTKDNAEYFESKVADINNAISSTNEAVDKANKAVADTLQATSDNTQRVDNALKQLETDTQQKFTELDTQVTNTVNGAVSDLNKAKEQAIADMEQATSDNTQRVDNAIQQIATKVGIDDTQSSTLTTYSSNKINEFISDVGNSISNINASLGDKIDTTGDVSEAVVSTLDEIPNTRLIPSVGDKIKVMFAKTIKYFQDLKTIAFTGDYEDLLNKPSIPTVTNNLLATESGTALDAVQGKAINDKIGSTDISGVGDGTVTGAVSTLNSNFEIEDITSKCTIQDGIKEAKIIKYGKIVFVFFRVSCTGHMLSAITGLPGCSTGYSISSIYINASPFNPMQSSSAWLSGNKVDIYTKETLSSAYVSFSYICE